MTSGLKVQFRESYTCHQRVVRVGLNEQVVDIQQDCQITKVSAQVADRESKGRCQRGRRTGRHLRRRLPNLRLEQCDADVALVVDVRVVDPRLELDLQGSGSVVGQLPDYGQDSRPNSQ